MRVGASGRRFGKSKNLLGDSRVAHRAAVHPHPTPPPPLGQAESEFKQSDAGGTSVVFSRGVPLQKCRHRV